MGDRDNYNQMVINLVDNAIKYTEPNGKVKVRIEKSGGNLILSVKDTGVGISEEHLPRLFERFYRVDKSRDRAKGGTGLGLAIVKHIRPLHEGRDKGRIRNWKKAPPSLYRYQWISPQCPVT